MHPSLIVEENLYTARSVRTELNSAGVKNDPQLFWIERQLDNLVSRLVALLADIESGCTPEYMGFLGDEFEEMMSSLSSEIACLKSMLQNRKILGLG